MMYGIQKRLLIYILSITTLFMVTISVLNYLWTKDVVVDLSEKVAAARADAAAARIEGYLLQKGQNAWTLAQNEQIHAFVEKVSSTPVDLENDEDYREMMKSFQRIVDQNPDIKHAYIAVSKTDRLYGNVEFNYPPGYTVNPRTWYQRAVEAGTLVFTEPYECPLTHNWVVSAAAPFYNDKGELLGVALVDILAHNIEAIVNNVNIFDQGYTFMLDNNGIAIVHPEKEYYMKSLVDNNDANPDMARLAGEMIQGKPGIDKILLNDRKNYVLYSPITQIGWSIGVVVPEDEIRDPIYKLGSVSLITVIVGIVIICLIIVILASRISKPLNQFAGLMKKVSDGDYTVRAHVKTRDEVGQLGNSLNNMLEKQERLIRKVITTAYKMGIAGNELAITMGGVKTTLPVVTTELGELIAKPGLKENEEKSRFITLSKSMRVFLEKLINIEYNNRLILEDLQEFARKTKLNNDQTVPENNNKITSSINNIGTRLTDTCQLSKDLQMDFADIISCVEIINHNFNDISNALNSINKHVNSISNIQSESINGATATSMKLVEWSQVLLQLTSQFNLDVLENDEEADN